MYLMHLLCLAPLWRYYHTLQALIYKRPTPTGTYNESLRDVSMLRLIEVGFKNKISRVNLKSIRYILNPKMRVFVNRRLNLFSSFILLCLALIRRTLWQ